MAPTYLSGLMLSAALLLASPVMAEAPEKPDAPRWGYLAGGNDDEGWGELSPDYALCTVGTNQSPVGIDFPVVSTIPPLRIDYHTVKGRMELKERTLVIDLEGNNIVEADGTPFRLTQIRFHSPAEHSLQDKLYVAEIHLIHEDAAGKKLILAILMDMGAENAALLPILEHVSAKIKTVTEVTFNPDTLLPSRKGYYAYSGSLSWPPCTEGVEWRVFKQAVTLSKSQLAQLGKLFGRNARLLQPLYMRTIRQTID